MSIDSAVPTQDELIDEYIRLNNELDRLVKTERYFDIGMDDALKKVEIHGQIEEILEIVSLKARTRFRNLAWKRVADEQN